MVLEEKILDNLSYLLGKYPRVEIILSQISTILDFGINENKINSWFKSKEDEINIIKKIIKRRHIR